jgi:hypothetical protein
MHYHCSSCAHWIDALRDRAVVPLCGDESYARYVKLRGPAPGRARTP